MHTRETDYDLIAISNETLAKLLVGEFKTFDSMIDNNNKQSSFDIELLVKEIEKVKGFVYEVESIFFNK